MKCWLFKTPFQMALILVLIVAIPFFIVLIILYLMFGAVWPDSEECEPVCVNLAYNLFKKNPNETVDVPAIHTNASKI